MKITIDTKEDSHEEIKKVISLLTHLIGEIPATTQRNIFEDTSSTGISIPSSGGIFGLFDSPPSSSTSNSPASKEEPEEKIEIIPY